MRSSLTAAAVRLVAATALGVIGVAGCSTDTSAGLGASIVAVISGNGQSGTVATSLATAIVVQVNDENGNPKSGALVTFAATGGATLGQTTATTDADGRAQTTVMLGTRSGTDTVTASSTGATTSARFTFTANADAPAALVVVSGNNQSATAGSTLTNALVVMVNDRWGNAASGATVDWTSTAGTFLGATQSTATASGTASASLQLPSVAGIVIATATLHGTLATAIFTETAM